MLHTRTNTENIRLSTYTISFGLSLALASVMDAALVIAKEKSPAVMTGMQRLTGHHWISHGVIVLGIFAVFGWMFAQCNGGRGIEFTASQLIGVLVSGVLVGGLIIVGFYAVGG